MTLNISDAKSRCYITADDTDTTNRLTRIIDDAEIKIRRLLGINDPTFDFSVASEERELLLNYIWYAWNDAENEFKENYMDDILSIRGIHEVAQFNESEGENET